MRTPGCIIIITFIAAIEAAGSFTSFSQADNNRCYPQAPRNKINVVAHGGAHKGIPENSQPACRKAIELGCDFVEIDVRTTRDGKFISMHNSKIDDYVSGYKDSIQSVPYPYPPPSPDIASFDGRSQCNHW